MPLKVDGDPGYGSMVGPGLSLSSNLGGSETLPLLIPSEAEPDLKTWKPLTREQLEAAAGGTGWKKFRSRLVLLFWLAWLTMLGAAIVVIVQSPRPVAIPLHWWQKELFYRLQPALLLDINNTESSAISSVKVILDLCDLGLPSWPQFRNETENPADASYVQDLRYWLEEGVSGFGICDTDPTYSEKTLTEWRGLVEEFSTEYNERIVLVKESGDSSPALNMSKPTVNSSLVDLALKPLLPQSSHTLSAAELADVMETRLKTLQEEWPSWTVDGQVAWELQNVVMVLMMTLPGTPVIRYGDEISQSGNVSTHESADDQGHKDTTVQNLLQSRRSTLLFQSLSRTRSREEALLYGTFTFLPFNSSTHSNSTAKPPLAFLRSWGCINVLVLFNLGSEPYTMDPDWAASLPEEGVYMTSTGLDRLGAVFLHSLKLQPFEAIVIKLFEADN